jgi:hypothetical protein
VPARDVGKKVRERLREVVRENDVIGAGDVNAMRERRTNQLCVDRRDNTADPADTEPGGDVIRPARLIRQTLSPGLIPAESA